MPIDPKNDPFGLSDTSAEEAKFDKSYQNMLASEQRNKAAMTAYLAKQAAAGRPTTLPTSRSSSSAPRAIAPAVFSPQSTGAPASSSTSTPSLLDQSSLLSSPNRRDALRSLVMQNKGQR